jgi:hypothetical protein
MTVCSCVTKQKKIGKEKNMAFAQVVYGTLKSKGIDTEGMSFDEAVEKFKEIQKQDSQANRTTQYADNHKTFSKDYTGLKDGKIKILAEDKYTGEKKEFDGTLVTLSQGSLAGKRTIYQAMPERYKSIGWKQNDNSKPNK